MSELWLQNTLEANSFLNTLFDNLNSAIFIVDQEARVRQVNQVFEKIFAKAEMESPNTLPPTTNFSVMNDSKRLC